MARKAEMDLLNHLKGTVAIEFALAMPFLMAVLVGTTEVGLAAYQAMQTKNAAEAGALYASQHPADLAGIQNAVTNATGTAGVTATPAPTGFCGCPGAGGIVAGDCVTLCASGSVQGHYVRVNA